MANDPSISLLHGSFDVALGVALGHVVALVIELFALGDTYFRLDPGVLKIEGKGNQSVAVALHQHGQLCDLPLVHEQLAGAHGILIKNIALFIGAYVGAYQKQFAVFDRAIAVLEINGAHAQGFDLGSGKRNAGFIGVLDKIVMPRLAVDRDGFRAFLCQDATSFDICCIIYDTRGR